MEERNLVQFVTNIHKGTIGINPILAITGCIVTISKDGRLWIGTNYGRVTPIAMALWSVTSVEVEVFLHPHLQGDFGPLHIIQDSILNHRIIIKLIRVETLTKTNMMPDGMSKGQLPCLRRPPQHKNLPTIRRRITLKNIGANPRHHSFRKIDGIPNNRIRAMNNKGKKQNSLTKLLRGTNTCWECWSIFVVIFDKLLQGIEAKHQVPRLSFPKARKELLLTRSLHCICEVCIMLWHQDISNNRRKERKETYIRLIPFLRVLFNQELFSQITEASLPCLRLLLQVLIGLQRGKPTRIRLQPKDMFMGTDPIELPEIKGLRSN